MSVLPLTHSAFAAANSAVRRPPVDSSRANLVLNRFRVAVLALTLVWGNAASAAAQTTGVPDGGPDPASVRMRVGPLWMAPRLELENFGVDTNVFNEPDDQNPKRDFTFTLTPKMDMWLRMGRSWLRFTIAEDLVWYQQYSSQRSANSHYDLSWRLPLNRLALTVSPTYLSTNERPGFEIDARIHHTEWGGNGSLDVRAFPKTSFGITGSYRDITFDDSAVYEGTNVAHELDRTEATAGVTVSHDLTPLTKVVFSATQERDRFKNGPLRDSDSTSVTGSVAFDPHALLKGGASFGFRDFRPLDSSLGGYRGLIASGDLTYTLLGATRFQVQFGRDVQYSYDVNQPYYLQTGVNGSIAQQIFGPFDAIARAGTARLAYQDRADTLVGVANRVDYNHTYGGGLGYHFSSGLRVGFNVDYFNRITDVQQRRYTGLRYGASTTYDF